MYNRLLIACENGEDFAMIFITEIRMVILHALAQIASLSRRKYPSMIM
jgi:hypothetical protein